MTSEQQVILVLTLVCGFWATLAWRDAAALKRLERERKARAQVHPAE